jgi:hypothetical protein
MGYKMLVWRLLKKIFSGDGSLVCLDEFMTEIRFASELCVEILRIPGAQMPGSKCSRFASLTMHLGKPRLRPRLLSLFFYLFSTHFE